MKAQADLDAEVAKLNELKGENVNDNSISTTRNIMFAAITNAYFVADDSIYNKINSFYNDETVRSSILSAYDDIDFYDDYKDKHNKSEYLLKSWKKSLSLVTSLNYTESNVETAEANLIEIKKFVELTARVVNDYNADDDSVYTRAEADALRAQVNQARENINSAINKINDARESTRDIKSEIPYQEARVKSAEATLNSYRSELSKRSVSAPFNGVITKQDAKVGEIVSANTVVMRLISDAKFTIETYVPEINISEVRISNTAKVTLDAYGDEQIFEAKIVSIDPGETIKDGVSTYKVLFEFVSENDRLKSGMTANVIITTEMKQGALLIPQEAIVKRNGFSYVNVLIGKETIEKQITLGSTASNGFMEVLAGLSAGEVVIKNVK
jgi:HlyD family secretion protein